MHAHRIPKVVFDQTLSKENIRIMDKIFLSGLLNKTSSKKEARNEVDSPRPSRSNSHGSLSPSALYGISASISSQSPGRAPEQLLFDAATCDLVILVADEINFSRALPAHKDVLRARNSSGYFGKLLAEPASFQEYSDKAAGPGSDAATGALASKPMIRRMHWPWQLASALLSFLYRDCCEVGWEILPELRRLAEEVEARGLCEAVDYLLDPQHLLPWTVSDMRAAALALKRHQLVEAADRYAGAMCATAVEESTRMATVVYHTRQSRPRFAISVSTLPSLPSIDGAAASLELPSLLLSPTSTPLYASASAQSTLATVGRDSHHQLMLRSPSSSSRASAATAVVATALTRSPSFSRKDNDLLVMLTSAAGPTAAYTAAANGNSGGSGGDSGGGGNGIGGGVISTTAAATIMNGDGGGSDGSSSFNSSSYYRDSRVGVDIVDSVMRSVALDSKVLRGLLLPGRRRDSVLLCGISSNGVSSSGGGGGGPIIHQAAVGTATNSTNSTTNSISTLPRRHYSSSAAFISNIVGTQKQSSSSYSVAAASRSGGGGSSSATAVGAAAAAVAAPARSSLELPLVASRLRSAAVAGSQQQQQQSGGGFGGGMVYGTSRCMPTGGVNEQPETPSSSSSSSSSTLELMVIVPAAHLATSLASLVQRPLEAHLPGYTGPTLLGTSCNYGNNINSSTAITTYSATNTITAATLFGSGGSGSFSNNSLGGSVGVPGSGLGSPGGGGGGNNGGSSSSSSNNNNNNIGGGGGGGGGGGISARKDPLHRDSLTNGLSNTHFNHHTSLASFDPFSKLSGVPGLTWGADRILMALNGTHGSVGATANCASLLQQLPSASSLGDYDQISLALALDVPACLSQTGNGLSTIDCPLHTTGQPTIAAAAAAVAAAMSGASVSSTFNATRLLGSVLTALGAADHPQYIVRADPAQAAHAVSFERRRAAADASSLNSLVGATATAGSAFASGIGAGSSVGVSASGVSTSIACATTANAAKAVVGPANPRDYFIPLTDNPTGAIAVTLPVGLVLVDAATLEGVSGPVCMNASSGNSGNSSGNTIGSGAGLCTSARAAALTPHLLASASALSHVISAVGLISQILRVAGEQHGLFSAPVLRACLRVFNPSAALLTVLIQTNTCFATSAMENTIYIRKSPADIVRLLHAILSTLPAKSTNGSIGASTGANYGPSNSGSICGVLSGGEAVMRARLGSGDSFTGGLPLQASRNRSNRSFDTRSSTANGYGSASGSTAVRETAVMSLQPSRRATTSELNLRASVTAVSPVTTPSMYGVPYNQLERLFPGKELHVVELSPPATMLEEF